MTHKGTSSRIAAIGIGPRGLGALEALAATAEKSGLTLEIDVFDPEPHAGAGPNFDIEESELCLLNLPVREISLAPARHSGASVGEFSSFASRQSGPETFPPRAELGRYLAARYDDLAANAQSLKLSRRRTVVRKISAASGGWWLITGMGVFGPYAEVLLTQGQPDSVEDEQLSRWQSHAQSTGAELVPAYPANDLLQAAANWAGKTVAIRGLGLSTLDVLRVLTCGLGGRFAEERYHRSGREPARILPFSLNGYAPFPKPADLALDRQYDPTPAETRAFESALATAISSQSENALPLICDAICGPAARILAATGNHTDEDAIRSWLETERTDPGAQQTRSPTEALRTGIAMAEGSLPPSSGYAIGQLWRKWQNALRRGFNPASVRAETAKALIGFDEGLKRFSYGPPLRSARELLMLIEDGMVDPRAAGDPDVELTATGWRLIEGDTAVPVSVMVDAVMPSPALERSLDPVITGLIEDGLLVSVADGLGARTRADGQVIDHQGHVQRGLSLLGRLALGSVIAVDSIHDCVGASTDRWADGVVARIGETLRQAA